MASEIDEEIRTIIEDAFATAEKLLSENIDKLHTIAEVLLEIETLDGEQFEALFTGEKTAKQIIEEVHNMEKSIQRANELEAVQVMEEEKEELLEEQNTEQGTEEEKNLKKETSEKVE